MIGGNNNRRLRRLRRLGLLKFQNDNLCNLRNLRLFILCLCLTGCRDEAPPVSSHILATVGGRAITQADFDREAAMRPGKTGEEVLNELIKHHALYLAATAAGVLDNPALKRELENRVITEWLETAFKRERDALTVTAAEILAAYEDTSNSLVKRPAQARFAILYQKGRNTAELLDALNDAIALFEADRAGATNNQRLPGFGKIAQDFSEDVNSRFKGGDMGWIGEGTGSRLPDEVLAAGWQLAVDEIAPPFAAGDGVYAIMKMDERALARVSLEEATPGLRRRLLLAKQTEFDARFMAGVTNGVSVKRFATAAGDSRPAARGDARPPTTDFGLPTSDVENPVNKGTNP